jgi:hypothetical protein
MRESPHSVVATVSVTSAVNRAQVKLVAGLRAFAEGRNAYR